MVVISNVTWILYITTPRLTCLQDNVSILSIYRDDNKG